MAYLLAALDAAVARRRTGYPAGHQAVWPPQVPADRNQIHGEKSTRILNILEDDPLFVELLTRPALLPYVHALTQNGLSRVPLLSPPPSPCADGRTGPRLDHASTVDI